MIQYFEIFNPRCINMEEKNKSILNSNQKTFSKS